MYSELADKFLADLEVVKKKAKAFPVRRSDQELYGVLSACLHMAYRVQREGIFEDVKSAFIKQERSRKEGKNYHVDSRSDIPLVIGRLVFTEEKGRNAAYRYCVVLREAMEREIQPQELVSYLTENGGMNALYRHRDRKIKGSEKKQTLFLLDPITVPTSGKFILELEDAGSGYYKVHSIKEI